MTSPRRYSLPLVHTTASYTIQLYSHCAEKFACAHSARRSQRIPFPMPCPIQLTPHNHCYRPLLFVVALCFSKRVWPEISHRSSHLPSPLSHFRESSPGRCCLHLALASDKTRISSLSLSLSLSPVCKVSALRYRYANSVNMFSHIRLTNHRECEGTRL